MKLVLRRIGDQTETDAYALHTEDGEILPQQAHVRIEQEPFELTRITVEFNVNDNDVRIESPS